ncbi:molybdenum cofactor guanylyltransferase [Actinomycetospora atypica]|uniref:Probable molybdenum cofactor guanylyltransferase n=1 Tax=Actinomycetospora atypica TaxID=1290095 RepID=A0ABV9YXN6_9PSEU
MRATITAVSQRTAAGVVLTGGRSRRMGRDKAAVPWRDGTLLDHVLAVLTTALGGPLVVVGSADSPGPAAGPRVLPVVDDEPGRGPLQGLATGLTAAGRAGAEVAFVCSVDLPLLHRSYVTAVLGALGTAEVALPVLHGHRQPLAAAYRTALGPRATALLAGGARRPAELFAVSDVRELTAADLLDDPDLAAADPELDAVRDADTPDDLAELRARDERRSP